MEPNGAPPVKTAPWIWKRCDAEAPLTVTPEHLATIRRLKVGFEEVENGAASLEIPDGVEAPADLPSAIEAFLNTATLDRFAGQVQNPYVPDDPDADLLQDVPDPEIRDLFAAGVDFDFDATDEEVAAFAEANLRSEGIDPKRPFGSEQPGRDLRPIIDPEKKLGRKEYSIAQAKIESRMMVLLQFFVQNAELAPGAYERSEESAAWKALADAEPEPDELESTDWYWRIAADFNLQNRMFSDTLVHLHCLVWDGRIDRPYAELTKELQLHNHYEDFGEPEYEGTTLEHALAGYEAFGERIFAVIAIRVLNAMGRFEEALELLVAVGRDHAPPDEADLTTMSYPNLGMLEAGIARYGSGVMADEEFDEWLSGLHPDMDGRSPYPLVSDMLQLQSMTDVDDPALGWHVRAASAQVAVMRGPFRP